MSDVLIRVEGVSKRFCRSLKRSLWYGLQDLGSELRGHRHGGDGQLRAEEFWAVRDVNIELKRGECLGIIGHNGAGKTTLLRMLNGLIKPDSGRIELRGRVGALIALGAGFNPVLTGRENIFVNASVLGLSARQVNAKLDEIVDFAEIGDFLDSPVRNYSSGMTVRLGFSIAAVLIEPDVLLLDEVLAVGDISFKVKALNAVRHLTQRSAVVLVSHNMQQVANFCTRAAVMANGHALMDTQDISAAIDAYYSLVKDTVATSGSGAAQVLDIQLVVDEEFMLESEPVLAHGCHASLVLSIRIDRPHRAGKVTVVILDQSSSPVIAMPLLFEDGTFLELPPGEHQVVVPFGKVELNGGKYSVSVGVRDVDTGETLVRSQGMRSFRVRPLGAYWGPIVKPTSSIIEHSDVSGGTRF